MLKQPSTSILYHCCHVEATTIIQQNSDFSLSPTLSCCAVSHVRNETMQQICCTEIGFRSCSSPGRLLRKPTCQHKLHGYHICCKHWKCTPIVMLVHPCTTCPPTKVSGSIELGSRVVSKPLPYDCRLFLLLIFPQ